MHVCDSRIGYGSDGRLTRQAHIEKLIILNFKSYQGRHEIGQRALGRGRMRLKLEAPYTSGKSGM